MTNLNFFKRIMNKKITPYCKFLCHSLFFDSKNNVKLCPFSCETILKENFDGIYFDVQEVSKKRDKMINEFCNSNTNPVCNNCFYLSETTKKEFEQFQTVYISNWQYCYLNCTYCNEPKHENLIEVGHYDVLPSICSLVDSKLIDEKTKIVFSSGDATVHPEFDKILYYFINQGMKNIVVNTPAMRYCESISEAIAKNICELVVSFDSGCPYIYEKIKGTNKFDISIANIKRYLEFQLPSAKSVVLKYTLVNGINDNQKEILDWFLLARDLGIKKLAFDIDEKWFKELQYSVPQYLKELLEFVKNMSIYNNIEIEFYDKIDILYKKIRQN